MIGAESSFAHTMRKAVDVVIFSFFLLRGICERKSVSFFSSSFLSRELKKFVDVLLRCARLSAEWEKGKERKRWHEKQPTNSISKAPIGHENNRVIKTFFSFFFFSFLSWLQCDVCPRVRRLNLAALSRDLISAPPFRVRDNSRYLEMKWGERELRKKKQFGNARRALMDFD